MIQHKNISKTFMEVTMSKLYTEEQVRKLLYKLSFTPSRIDNTIDSLKPIELPTDEKIERKSVEYSTDTETKEFYKDCCWDFQNGAKWILDKIKGGGDE